jgi:2-dehydro-3-deoxyphosphogluconate aldolase / (4S)-4-hydroxy-2-oxoglutarate aldolase
VSREPGAFIKNILRGDVNMQQLIDKIEDSKIFAIIRGVKSNQMRPLFDALCKGGIKLAEITLNTENALESISQMRKEFGSQMIIGAGTVLDRDMAKKAIESGAQFIVSPNLDVEVIEEALANNVLPIPGVMTPTEIVQAMRHDAKLVKLFPASDLGPGYVKSVLAALNDAKIVVVGGVNDKNAENFIKSGAIGLGIGGNLVDKDAIARNDFNSITEYAISLRNSLGV